MIYVSLLQSHLKKCYLTDMFIIFCDKKVHEFNLSHVDNLIERKIKCFTYIILSLV